VIIYHSIKKKHSISIHFSITFRLQFRYLVKIHNLYFLEINRDWKMMKH